MDIRNLPEPEQQIYRRISRQYQLTFDRLRVGEREIRLLKVANLEEFLAGRDPFADVTNFPFWIRLWDAAMLLAYVLGAQKETAGRRLLELGAGLGAPGLAAAAAGYTVTISDYEEQILDFQRVSAAASGLHGIEFLLLDWLAPPPLARYDLLAGAEILFRESFFEPLLQLFGSLLEPGGEIILAHDARRQSLGKFLQLAQADFAIAWKEQVITRKDKKVTIVINRLRQKTRG